MNNMDMIAYQEAYCYASIKHSNQYRIGGLPYITHPMEVAEMLIKKGYGTDYIVTALFHDLLEDTNATDDEILSIGGTAVLEAVKLLTKPKNCVMADYIDGIRRNPIAFAVKGADRLHNLRCAFDADESFRIKYVTESVEWYLDFCDDIPYAVKSLFNSIEDAEHKIPSDIQEKLNAAL